MTFLESIDKEKFKKKLLIVISALTLVALALLLVIIVVSIAPGGIKGFKNYTVTERDLKTGTLILADDDHPYDVDESWLNLVEGCQAYRNEQLDKAGIDSTDKNNYSYIPYKGMRLSTVAMSAAHRMLTDAKNAVNQKPVVIDGTYGVVYHGGADKVEFNTGHLMYLSDYLSEATAHVALSSEYRAWFDQNAAKYGFIESFEDGYRYVGEAHATYMKLKSMTLAQYIAHLKSNTSQDNPLDITDENGVKYQVYYVSCRAGDEIKVPKNDYTISGTNEGGVIITAKVSN